MSTGNGKTGNFAESDDDSYNEMNSVRFDLTGPGKAWDQKKGEEG